MYNAKSFTTKRGEKFHKIVNSMSKKDKEFMLAVWREAQDTEIRFDVLLTSLNEFAARLQNLKHQF